MDWSGLRERLTDPRLDRYRRWALPAAAAAIVAMLLAPGLVSYDRADAEPAISTQTIPIPDPTSPSPEPNLLAMGPSDPAPPAAISPDPPIGESDKELPESFDSVIEPSETVELGSPVTGVIDKIYVDRGAMVKAGDPVAELESSVERSAVELAQARAEMEGALKAREASYHLGQRRRQRVNQLFEKETLSADLLDQTETEARIAELDLVEIQEHKRLASLELKQARALLRRRTIRAPVDGIVVSRDMTAGEVVIDEKTIATLAQIDPLQVEVILPSALYGTIRAGQRAAIEPEFGENVHLAQVTIVDRVIDAASGTFGVRLALPNPDYDIPGGLPCPVRFVDQ
jgi:RND family efflux transporter MFP subunit